LHFFGGGVIFFSFFFKRAFSRSHPLLFLQSTKPNKKNKKKTQPLHARSMANIQKQFNGIQKKAKSQFKKMDSIFKLFECPIKIIKSFDQCYWMFGFDLLGLLVWAVVSSLLLLLLYLPLKLFSLIAKHLIPSMGFSIALSDCIPAVSSTSMVLETCVSTLFGKSVFYRNKKDLDKCYCFKPLAYILFPLRKKGMSPSDLVQAQYSASFIAALCTLFFIGCMRNLSA
jgi:hypothetical protein